MLFIEWWAVRLFFIGLVMVAVATFSFWFVGKKGWLVRLPIRLVAGLCGAAGLWVIWSLASSSHVYSVPIYSPNQKMAVRIDHYNPGEIGGPTYDSVQLFSAHGFNSTVVFSGQWESVETSNLRWKSESELEIYYKGTADVCKSTFHVGVRCFGR